MGVESNNYVVELEPCDTASLVAVLGRRGAVTGKTPLSFVLSSDDHWIDALVRPGSATRKPKIELRVALTNPPAAIEAVLGVLAEVLSACRGTVFDRASSETHHELDSGNRLRIVETWNRRREEFAEHFGTHVWPISGADVFARLRASGRD